MQQVSPQQQIVGTLRQERVGPVYVMVHSALDPSDSEWDALVTGFEQCALEVKAGLVYTMGGGPNARQRKLLVEMFKRVADKKGAQVPVLIVTPSPKVRAILTAINFFTSSPNKVFKPEALREVIRDLDLGDRFSELVLDTVRRFASELGIPTPP